MSDTKRSWSIEKVTQLLSGAMAKKADKTAIVNVTRSSTTFTATRADGTTFTFTQQDNNTVPAVQCETAAGTAAKDGTCTNYTLTANTWVHVNLRYANSYNGAITLNINSKGDKPIYINGSASSSSNKTLPAGTYLVFYDGTAFQFRTDGKLPGSITGDAATVNGHTVGSDVPSDLAAAVGDYTWNQLGFGS